MDFSILVGGEAGQGMDTFAGLLEKVLKRSGYYVFSIVTICLEVRGGHSFFYIRFSDKPIYSYASEVDIVFALNYETVKLHKSKLKDGGIIITDEGIAKDEDVVHLNLIGTAKSLRNTRVYTTIGRSYT